jgi:hypothetical protein
MTAIGYRQFVNRNLPIRERACMSKAVFLSRREALNRIGHGHRGYAGLKPYRCQWCDGWHLGHARRTH